jgi:hypothetical protein
VVGVLVHRMLQRELDPALDDAALGERAVALLSASERVETVDVDRAVDDAIGLYRAVRRDSALATLLSEGERYFEVPFSVADPEVPAVWLRGSVDCLVRRRVGSLVVLEFKTGRPRTEHRSQLELYMRAVQAVFPEADVSGRVFYPEDALSLPDLRKPGRGQAGLG